MSQVPVFVPWHVAARDAAERWLPQARPTRYIVAGLATSVATLVTVAILWMATQTDVLVLATGAAGDELRGVAMDAGRRALAAFSASRRWGSFKGRAERVLSPRCWYLAWRPRARSPDFGRSRSYPADVGRSNARLDRDRRSGAWQHAGVGAGPSGEDGRRVQGRRTR